MKWIANTVTRPDGEPIESIDDVVETVIHSARQSDSAVLHAVLIDEPEPARVVCYTGNGPNSEYHATLIAHMPVLLKQACDLLDEIVNGDGENIDKADPFIEFVRESLDRLGSIDSKPAKAALKGKKA